MEISLPRSCSLLALWLLLSILTFVGAEENAQAVNSSLCGGSSCYFTPPPPVYIQLASPPPPPPSEVNCPPIPCCQQSVPPPPLTSTGLPYHNYTYSASGRTFGKPLLGGLFMFLVGVLIL